MKALSAHEVFICILLGCQGLVIFSKSSSSKEKLNARLADVSSVPTNAEGTRREGSSTLSD